MTDDADGTPVPDALIPLWSNAFFITRMTDHLTHIILLLKCAKGLNDPQYLEVNLPDAIAQAKLLKAHLERAIPHAVCPACQGAMRSTCKLCKGRGAISKFLWESPAVRDAIKQLRRKVNK
jgi:hypothetical protein